MRLLQYINLHKLILHRQTKFGENIWDNYNVSVLVTAIALLRKIGEIDNKIPHTSGLVTTTVLNTKIGKVENKIRDVSGLVKKQIITLTLRKIF